MDTCDIDDDTRRLCVYAATLSVVAVLKVTMKRLLCNRYITTQPRQNKGEGSHVCEQTIHALKAKTMIEADGITWKECLKSHPSAGTCCSRPFKNFDDISLIFGNDQGTDVVALNGIDAEFVDQHINVKESRRSIIGPNGIADDAVHPFPFQVRLPPPPDVSRSTTNKGSVKRKRKRKETMDGGLLALNSTLQDIATAIRDVSVCVDTKRIMEELMKTPRLSEDQIISAIDYVGVDKKRANIFCALSGEMRKKWLLKYI